MNLTPISSRRPAMTAKKIVWMMGAAGEYDRYDKAAGQNFLLKGVASAVPERAVPVELWAYSNH